MSFWVQDALADTGAAQPAAGGLTGSLIMIVGFVVIFYFMLWRPQSKRAKEHRELVSSIGKGDEVMTNGGVLGRVSEVNDDFITLAIAANVEIQMQKGSVASVLPKGTLKF